MIKYDIIECIFCKILIDLNSYQTVMPVVINTWKIFDFIKEEQLKSNGWKLLLEKYNFLFKKV